MLLYSKCKSGGLMRIITAFMCCLLVASSCAYAGVIVGGTRLIYNAGTKETSISVKNPENSTPYLIQSWTDNAGPNDDNKGAEKPPFIVTPPLFRLDPGIENTLRVVKLKDAALLPKDRESVFWLNVKSIPAQSKNADGSVTRNTLQISVKTRIKLFYRPEGITETTKEAAERLSFKRTAKQLIVTNPTPYYFTFNTLKVGQKDVDSLSTMVPPKGEMQYTLNGTGNNVEWNYINDFGGVSKMVTSPLK